MSRTILMVVAIVTAALAAPAHAAISVRWVETPIPASAVAADPALALYRRHELRVTQVGEHFASADLQFAVSSGKLYTPPAGNGSFVRTDLWGTSPAYTNLYADTAITTPDSYARPLDGGGNFDVFHLTVFGAAGYPANHLGQPLVMPNLTNGGNAVDIAWADPQPTRSAFSDGTYVIAVITENCVQPERIRGRVGGTVTTEGVTFDFLVPEPTIPSLAALAFAAITLRRPRALLARAFTAEPPRSAEDAEKDKTRSHE